MLKNNNFGEVEFEIKLDGVTIGGGNMTDNPLSSLQLDVQKAKS